VLKIKNKKICIVSYIHESGLYYLSKYFYDDLKDHNEIIWIPKIRYKLVGKRYGRFIEKSESLILPNAVKILDKDEYIDFFGKNKFDYILSFESNLREQWVNRNMSKITDIPMIEWVNFSLIDQYKFFKEVYCLNNYTFQKLKDYGKCNEVSFKLEEQPSFRKEDLYYHQASLNSEYSSKNTLPVIKAFRNANAKLIITGILSDQEKNLLTANIQHLGIVSRDVIFDIYRKSSWLIAPSDSEGFGLQIYEAKSFGCKVLTSDFPTIKELGDITINLYGNIEKQLSNMIFIDS